MSGLAGIVDQAFAPELEADRREQVTRMLAALAWEPHFVSRLAELPELGATAGRVGFAAEEARGFHQGGGLLALVSGPVSVSGPGSAAALAERYRRRGVEGLAEVPGRCAGFAADRPAGRAVLANDRYGAERVFVYRDGGRTYFASEAKAILAVAPGARAFDPEGLAEWLACGCTLGRRSLFRGIEVLPAATAIEFTGGRGVEHRYFTPSRLEATAAVSADDFLEGFGAALGGAVQAAASEPGAGISLTAGLDSRMIAAVLEARPGTVPCYTFGSMYRTSFDVAAARRVAAICGQPHQVLELGRTFLEDFPAEMRRAVYASDGYLGMSAAAELHVNRMARAVAPARITGNWGGELLRGVRAFKYVPPRGGFLRPQLSERMQAAGDAFAAATAAHPVSFVLFHQMPLQGYGRNAVERSQMEMRAPFLDTSVVEWLYRMPGELRAGNRVAEAVLARRPELLGIPTDAGQLGSGPEWWKQLRRNYRKTVVKAEYATSHGAPDWLARWAARLPAPLLETRFLGRNKFQHFRWWMRTELAGHLRDRLTDSAARELGEWFDPAQVARMVDEHIAARANFTDELDKVLTVAVAREVLFDAAPAETVRSGDARVFAA